MNRHQLFEDDVVVRITGHDVNRVLDAGGNVHFDKALWTLATALAQFARVEKRDPATGQWVPASINKKRRISPTSLSEADAEWRQRSEFP